MREVLVISGKGGTGKTSLTAAFAHLASDPIICDLDVDAPDLHLLLQPRGQQYHDFYSGHTARIIPDRCSACGTCRDMCRFDAIGRKDAYPVIDPFKCEGCKVCVHFCPQEAIAFEPAHCGVWYKSQTRFGAMLHAQLFPAEENSGRLVALLRREAKAMAATRDPALVLCDGPPGIGCPVISALSGVHLAVIVTEPTPSGRHDVERIISLCRHFSIPFVSIINKFDLNTEISAGIDSLCRQKGGRVIAEIPHDSDFINAMVRAQTITEYNTGPLAATVRRAWDRIAEIVEDTGLAIEPAEDSVPR